MNTAEEARAEVVIRWHKAAEQHTLGNMSKAVEGWGASMDFQREMAVKFGFPLHTRYFPDVGFTVALGHLAALEIFIKMKILGMTDTNFVVVADQEKIVNPAYFDLLRPHLTVKTWAELTEDISLTQDYLAVIEVEGKWTWFIDALGIVQERWDASGRGPLLKLSPEQIAEGRQKLGLAPSEWFVALHIRKLYDAQNLRDIDADSYDGAIKLIEEAGGKVIRVPSGDPALDVFLLAQSRFVILGNSGPAWVAGTFGTPALLANWVPVGIKFPYKGAVLLPKKLWLSAENRFFTPEEYCEPFNHIVSEAVLTQHGVVSVPNTAEELIDGVGRMLRATGEYSDASQDAA